MAPTCATCGQPPSAGCACAGPPAGVGAALPETGPGHAPGPGLRAEDPFRLEDFAPELASSPEPASPPPAASDPPAPAPSSSSAGHGAWPSPSRPVLEIVRSPEPPSGPSQAALAAAAADASRTGRDRGRRRLPSGIRLVIRRHRQPAPAIAPRAAHEPPPAVPPAPAPAVDALDLPPLADLRRDAARVAEDALPTTAGARPELDEQARLLDALDVAPSPPTATPAERAAAETPAPPTTRPETLAGLLGAFAGPAGGDATAWPATAPSPGTESGLAPDRPTTRSRPAFHARPATDDATALGARVDPASTRVASPDDGQAAHAAAEDLPQPTAALARVTPSSAPARTGGPIRAERVHVRPRAPGEDGSPHWGPRPSARTEPGWSASASASRAASAAWERAEALASHLTGPVLATLAGSVLLLGVAAILPAACGALVAGAAALLARSDERAGRSPTRTAERLAIAGLGLSAVLALLGLLVRAGLRLPAVASRLARPADLLLPLGLLGLALAASAAWVLARRYRATALASVALPLAVVACAWTTAPGTGGLALSAAALGLAALAGSGRDVRAETQRSAAAVWAACCAGLAIAAAAGTVLLPAGWPLAAPLALAALVPATALGTLRLTRSYDETARAAARVAGVGLALGIGALTLGAGPVLGARIAWGAAALPLAGVGHLLLVRWKDRRHHSRLDAPWLAPDGRRLAAVGAAIAAAAIALAGPGRVGFAATALGALAAVVAADPSTWGRPALRPAAPLLAWGSISLLAATLGMPLRWLPAVGAAGLALLPICTAALGWGRRRTAPAVPWTLPVLVGSAVTLVGALGVSAATSGTSGAGWLAGAAGVLVSVLAPAALRALPVPAGPTEGPAAARALTLPAHLALLALAPAAPLLATGHVRWTAPVLALEGLAAWLVSRRRPRALPAVAALLAATVLLLPALPSRAGFLPGALALAIWGIVAALETALAARVPVRGTRRAAASVAVTCVVALTCWLSAAAGAAEVALLVAAVVLQAADRLASDAILGRALREATGIAWVSGVLLSGLQAPEDPLRAALLMAGAALASVLVAALRGEESVLLLAGIAGSASLAAGCLHVGLSPARHPAAFLAPAATFTVAWGVLQAWRARPFRGSLAVGLGMLASGVLVEAHLPASPPLLRVVAGALAATIVAGGLVSRHRIPVVVGGAALGIEAAWLLAEAVGWIAHHPLPGLTIVAAVMVAAAALTAHVTWRAGGRAPLLLAWTSDLARLREGWSRWQ